MNYRFMQISDYAAVMKLWRDCEGLSLRDADSLSGIEKYLERNPGLSFVALDGTRIVGSIMAGHDGKRGYIQHLAVIEELRGLGVASELVGRCLSALKSQGIEKSHVHVLRDNALGRRYWTGRGWTERSEVVMYSFINSENDNA